MAKSEDRAIANALSDLKTFTQISKLLEDSEGKDSLRRIAFKMGVSATSIVECLKRLNLRYSVKLAETNEAIKSVHITEAGKTMIAGAERIFRDFGELERRVEKKQDDTTKFSARIGVSPYLLSTILPAAVMECVDAFKEQGGARIDTEEAYDTDKFIKRIEQQELDFALVWDYQGRKDLIKRMRGMDCAFSEKKFDSLVVFRREHHKEFTDRIDTREPYVYIDELGINPLYVLQEGHRFLDNELPAPELKRGGRIESYSIASMLGSIRAGMPGIAIVPSLYRDLDRFRRDGSISFLPLKDRVKNKKVPIKLLYVFQSKYRKPNDLEPELITSFLGDRDRFYMQEGAIKFIRFLEAALNDQPEESGWQVESTSPSQRITDHESGLERAVKSISKFVHSYHISSDNIGIDRPSWRYASAKFNGLSDTTFDGTFTAHRPKNENVIYTAKGELIHRRIVTLQGIQTGILDNKKTPDCFVANLNFVNPQASVLIGVWSGRDTSAANPMAGPIVFSKTRLDPHQLRTYAHIAMVRQLTSVTGSVNARFDEIIQKKA